MTSGSQVWSGFSANPREPDAASIQATDADRDHAFNVLRDQESIEDKIAAKRRRRRAWE